MKNDKGFSFVETILTLSILFLLFGTLMPLTNQMMLRLAEKKVSLHIAITKNQAATSIRSGIESGVVKLGGIDYLWEWNRPVLCVNYTFYEVNHESCETY